MKTFIAYRFTGEDPKALEPLLTSVCDALKKSGIDPYCTFFDDEEFKNKSYDARQIMEHAFKIIDESDFLFVLLTSESKSEGMLMEVGYCIAKGIPIIVAVKDDVQNTYVPNMGKVKLVWNNPTHLAEEIQKTKFHSL